MTVTAFGLPEYQYSCVAVVIACTGRLWLQALEKVSVILAKERGNLTIEEQVRQLLQSLQHDSASVKATALQVIPPRPCSSVSAHQFGPILPVSVYTGLTFSAVEWCQLASHC